MISIRSIMFGFLMSSSFFCIQAVYVGGYKQEIIEINDFVENLSDHNCCFFQERAKQKVKTFLGALTNGSSQYLNDGVRLELFLIEVGRILRKSITEKEKIQMLVAHIKSFKEKKPYNKWF